MTRQTILTRLADDMMPMRTVIDGYRAYNTAAIALMAQPGLKIVFVPSILAAEYRLERVVAQELPADSPWW